MAFCYITRKNDSKKKAKELQLKYIQAMLQWTNFHQHKKGGTNLEAIDIISSCKQNVELQLLLLCRLHLVISHLSMSDSKKKANSRNNNTCHDIMDERDL